MLWLNTPPAEPDAQAAHAAEARQARLTKPPGALGRLEAIAIRLAALQGRERPRIEGVRIAVFAGDHGVAAQGVSAFPQAVTAEMVKNFARGGAAINVLARALDAELEVIDLGTAADTGDPPGVIGQTLGRGTADFTREPAMSRHQLA
ncbi:MAG TPA: nicotinate-nucleotide--dimethylbenzimidazole phosphoribosyltransferase, partial [Gammaproteobacteria bacterium]|nr:nicotinate-nucleotide--dimethylbenzimidazole phosphoribosyltransferase [Gammaproteobacteria bacterium]